MINFFSTCLYFIELSFLYVNVRKVKNRSAELILVPILACVNNAITKTLGLKEISKNISVVIINLIGFQKLFWASVIILCFKGII